MQSAPQQSFPQGYDEHGRAAGEGCLPPAEVFVSNALSNVPPRPAAVKQANRLGLLQVI